MKIEFDCKRISISNNDFGCNISFNENEQDGGFDLSYDDIMNSTEKYVLIQRTYPENEFETDYCYIETNNPNVSGELKKPKIILSKFNFILTTSKVYVLLTIQPNEKEYLELKEALGIILSDNGTFRIEE